MEDYSRYNRKFKRLLESKSGNVKPLLKESDMGEDEMGIDQPHFVEEGDEMGIDQPHFTDMEEGWEEEDETWYEEEDNDDEY
jgi:hypothetical protein